VLTVFLDFFKDRTKISVAPFGNVFGHSIVTGAWLGEGKWF